MTTEASNALGPEDIAILELESPTVAGHTCKVVSVEAPTLGQRLTVDALRESIAARIGSEPRLTERLSSDRHPEWEPDLDFDIANHVLGYATAAVDRPRLLEIVAELITTRLDRSRPLWAIHVVDMVDDRVALVTLLHHSMADGATAMRMLSNMLWDPVARGAAPEVKPSAHAPVLKQAGTSLRATVRRELMPKGAETPLDRHPTERRTVAVARASLSELKRIGKEVGEGATINDVVLCAAAGGLREWLLHHEAGLEGVRVKVPVSLHDHNEKSDAIGNHDSFMVVDVGTEEPDPALRLRSIAAQTREEKADHDAQTLDQLFSKMRHVSGLASQALGSWTNSPRVFAVNISNVPGPRSAVSVDGGLVSDLFTLAEIGDRHALRIAAISMADELSFGLCADAAAVPDPERIAIGIEADLATLAAIPAD